MSKRLYLNDFQDEYLQALLTEQKNVLAKEILKKLDDEESGTKITMQKARMIEEMIKKDSSLACLKKRFFNMKRQSVEEFYNEFKKKTDL